MDSLARVFIGDLGNTENFCFQTPAEHWCLKRDFPHSSSFSFQFLHPLQSQMQAGVLGVCSRVYCHGAARRFFGWVTLHVVLLPKVSPGLQIITLLYIATLLLTIIKVTGCCINNFFLGEAELGTLSPSPVSVTSRGGQPLTSHPQSPTCVLSSHPTKEKITCVVQSRLSQGWAKVVVQPKGLFSVYPSSGREYLD